MMPFSLELGLGVRGQKMQTVLDGILRRFIGAGRLSVRWPDGRLSLYSGSDGPSAGMTIHNSATIRRLVAELPQPFREAIVLRHFEGLSFAEVASRMGRSVDSVEKLWVRALGKLRQAMTESAAGESGERDLRDREPAQSRYRSRELTRRAGADCRTQPDCGSARQTLHSL